MTKNKEYPRSVGEILRTKDESFLVDEEKSCIETFVWNRLNVLTVIETYYQGYVGEIIVAHSYSLTRYTKRGVEFRPINSVEDLKSLYNTMKGRKLRTSVWFYIKNFKGYSEDPRPYCQ